MGEIEFQKGDIILKRGTDLISKDIEFISHSRFSHAALVSNPNLKLVIEATLLGVAENNMNDLIDSSTVFRMKDLTDQQADHIINYAKQQIGKPYDYEQLVDQFLKYVLFIPNNEIEKGRFICSTFVNAAYASAGIKLTAQNLPSPEDIYESPLLFKVGDI